MGLAKDSAPALSLTPPDGVLEGEMLRVWGFTAIVLLCMGGVAFVVLRRPEKEERPPGRWMEIGLDRGRGPRATPSGELSDEQQAQIKRLEAIGYLGGARLSPTQSGVVFHEPDLAFAGLNLVISGHAPEAILTDMNGEIVHRWRYEFHRIWEDGIPEDVPESVGRDYWRRVLLYPNGDLLAIFDGLIMIKLDSTSKLLWTYRERCHHDAFILEDGRILTLIRNASVKPQYDPIHPILEDFLVILDAKGKETYRLSLLEAFLDSDYAPALNKMKPSGDIFHTNAVEVLDGSLAEASPAFRKGNVLVSVRELDMIAVVDLESRLVVWTLTGLWTAQHEPRVLDNGHLIIFDNGGDREMSRVLELDPFTQEIFWSFPPELTSDFYSETCGAAQRLPNGNTLITETDRGRAFEVTQDHRIAWEYVNPHRAGEQDQFIATLLRVERIREGYLRIEELGEEKVSLE